ncbi:pheromone autoinducer 2 transporter [Slackia heliotrinireducens]|uniref:Predicted permease n=1 Tax=Slackia heliotrinireducens (strain ATCC 29202 / DSM 20476 / NCTC 11029 / RHS 1) TaxID=471855 RepID=C7N3A4_SLAHD|nr:AI-2E family transporter [Slackia heliotrinireducens]ACV23627.1 predicted permease [Slackia heliotrinireducens DSM 20476]VEH03120.1 pheromone autoinducer 2 transporter [Slackia heliotrinireducens]
MTQENETVFPLWRTCLRIGVTVFIVYLAITYWPMVATMCAVLINAAEPIIIGAALAYIINILMSFYERHYGRCFSGALAKRLERPVCMGGAIITIVGIVGAIMVLVVPQFVGAINTLVQSAPAAVNNLLSNESLVALIPASVVDYMKELDWNTVLADVTAALQSGIAGWLAGLSNTFTTMLIWVMGIIFAMYFLASRDRVVPQIKRVAKAYMRPEWYAQGARFAELLDDSFHKYVVGQCTEAVILGVLCFIGMTLLRLPYASMIAALIGLTALIPIVGAYLGAAVGAFMILTFSWQQSLEFLVFIIVLQQIEGNFIYPKVVGTSVGLSGVLVLAAVTIGGAVSGIFGMLVAVPLVAAGYRVLKEDVAKREAAFGTAGDGAAEAVQETAAPADADAAINPE